MDNREILKSLSKQVLAIYNKKKDDLNISLNLEELMDKVIIEIEEKLRHIEDIDDSLYEKTVLSTYNKKHKWVKHELESPSSSLAKDIEIMTIMFKKQNTIVENSCFI